MARPKGSKTDKRRDKWRGDWKEHLLEQYANTSLSVASICKQDDMPGCTTVFKELANDADFAKQYARAREAKADAIFDETFDIADDARNDFMVRDGQRVVDHENIQRSRLRIDQRKWAAGKLNGKYSEKLTVDATIKDETLSPKQQQERIEKLIPQIAPILIDLGWTPPESKDG